MDSYTAALQGYYGKCRRLNLVVGPTMHASLRDYEEYRGKIQELTNNFARKGQRQVGRDPQDGQSTWDEVQLLQLVHAMMACIPTMGHGGPAVMRDLSIIMWLTKTLGRGDEGRLNYLQDMLLPQLVRSIGPCACWVLGAVVAGGKTTKANQSRKVGCIRAANPLLCAHFHLARWLVARFTLQQAPFPSPLDAEQWSTCPLWPPPSLISSRQGGGHLPLPHQLLGGGGGHAAAAASPLPAATTASPAAAAAPHPAAADTV